VTASNTLLGKSIRKMFPDDDLCFSLIQYLCTSSLPSVRPTCRPSATAEWPWTKFSPWSWEIRRRRTLNSIYTSATIHIFVSLSEVPCSLLYIISTSYSHVLLQSITNQARRARNCFVEKRAERRSITKTRWNYIKF